MNWEFEVEMDMDALFAPVTMESLTEMLDRREMIRLQREAEKRAKAEKENKNQNQGQSHSHGRNNSQRDRTAGPDGMGGGMGSLGNMRNILR